MKTVKGIVWAVLFFCAVLPAEEMLPPPVQFSGDQPAAVPSGVSNPLVLNVPTTVEALPSSPVVPVIQPEKAGNSSVSRASAVPDEAASTETDAIAASVNGEPISVRDLLTETMRQEAIIHATLPVAERGAAILKLRKEALENAINRKLLQEAYRKQTFQIPEQYIESTIDRIALDQAIRSRKEFYAKLREQKMTPEALRKMILEQLIVQAMTARQLQIRGGVTPREIREYFDAHSAELGKEERWELAMIVLAPDSPVRTMPGGLEAFAKQLKGAPEQFAALAAVYSSGQGASDGGSIGLLPKKSIRPDFSEACKDAKEGDIIGPVHAREADYFLKICKILPAEVPVFADAEPVIREKLERERRKKVMDEYFLELRKNALIQIYQ